MKVVINTCFGGFSLSKAAIARLAELQGRACYFFKTHPKHYDRYVLDDDRETGFFTAFDIPNVDDVLGVKRWADMTDAERAAQNEFYHQHYLTDMSEDRTDPLLVQVVEELGARANGSCADLKVVEIPDGIEWEIDEYDGNERVEEKHRSWS